MISGCVDAHVEQTNSGRCAGSCWLSSDGTGMQEGIEGALVFLYSGRHFNQKVFPARAGMGILDWRPATGSLLKPTTADFEMKVECPDISHILTSQASAPKICQVATRCLSLSARILVQDYNVSHSAPLRLVARRCLRPSLGKWPRAWHLHLRLAARQNMARQSLGAVSMS